MKNRFFSIHTLFPNNPLKEENKMKVSDFAVAVAKLEGKKKQVNIAQIKETLRVTNKLLMGKLYMLIRKDKMLNEYYKYINYRRLYLLRSSQDRSVE